MPQLFGPVANTLARGSILLLGAAPVLLLAAGSTVSRSAYNTNQHVVFDQPVPFSHKHHVQELGIDCRFCHPNVTKSGTAGVPATEVCMSCHSQVWTNSPLLKPIRDSWETGKPLKFENGDPGWNKVHALPEFVYFNHSIHIDRGISCAHCHGVQEQHLTSKTQVFSMEWCLDCHRNPEKFLYEDESVPGQTAQQKVFAIFRKQQEGVELTKREKALLDGVGNGYKPTPEELAKGLEIIERYRIKKEQLADCWVCHR